MQTRRRLATGRGNHGDGAARLCVIGAVEVPSETPLDPRPGRAFTVRADRPHFRDARFQSSPTGNPAGVETRALRILGAEEADGRPRLRREDVDKTGPLFISSGLLDLICGTCTFLLIKGWMASPEMLQEAVIECPNCFQLNGF